MNEELPLKRIELIVINDKLDAINRELQELSKSPHKITFLNLVDQIKLLEYEFQAKCNQSGDADEGNPQTEPHGQELVVSS